MNKQDALKELSQVEKRLKELRKIIEQPESIFDRIKTLEQAKETLSIKDDCFSTNNHSKRAFAFQNLCIIIEALNEGWRPDWDNQNEYKYYNYFYMKDGFSFSYVLYCHFTATTVPSALCFKSRELAEHMSNIAFNEFKEYYS